MVNTLVKQSALWILATVCFWTAAANAQTLTASLDRTSISMNETVTLRVRFEGAQAQGSPDFSVLSNHFDILNNQQSSQHSVINGNVTISTEWTLMLAAKNSGQILIPPFTLQGQRSKPLRINVKSAAANPNTGKEDVFVELSVDKNEVFVNEQFMLTFSLHFNQNIDSLDKPDLTIANARIQELNRVDYQKTIGQVPYGVAEYRYLVFPDTTGEITIDPQTWTIRTTDQPNVGRFGLNRGRIKLYRPKTEALTVNVQPKPASYPAQAAWLPATDVAITERWSRAPSSLKVGEPITWSITITAEGATSEQLPPLLQGLEPNGFKTYPDQPSHETTLQASSVKATRTESVAIVPNAAGELKLPAVELSWWDTEEKTVKVARLAARTLYVAPNAEANINSAAPVTQVTPNTNTATEVIEAKPYTPLSIKILLAILTLSNLMFAVLLWMAKSTKPALDTTQNTHSAGNKSFKALQQTLNKGNEAEIRAALLVWAKTALQHKAPVTLQSLANMCAQDEHKTALLNLDAALYAKTPVTFARGTIKGAVEELQKVSQQKKQNNTELKPLYAA